MSERFILPHLKDMKTSPFSAVASRAQSMKGVMTFGIGDPDFETPRHIVEAARRSLEEGETHYPPESGLPELREAISAYHARYGTDWRPMEEVTVAGGSSLALFIVMAGTLNRGDEVVLFEPYYTGYTRLLEYLNLRVVPVRLREERRYHFDPEEVGRRVSPRTRMIILCNPNNPTGTVYTEEELGAVAEAAVENDTLVLSDEIYDQFIYEGGPHRSIAALPGMRERTVVVMSFSKTFAMTGWRLGCIIADEALTAGLRRIPVWDRPPIFVQKGGVAALRGPWGPVEEFRREFRRRRDYLVERLNAVEGLSCVNPEGAFYLFPNFEATGRGSVEFCEGLLEDQRLLLTPGVSSGALGEYHARIPLVKNVEFLGRCADAIEKYVRKIGA